MRIGTQCPTEGFLKNNSIGQKKVDKMFLYSKVTKMLYLPSNDSCTMFFRRNVVSF